MTTDEIAALKLRANAVRFQLISLTEDMNEVLREFEAACCARFRTRFACEHLGQGASLVFDGFRLSLGVWAGGAWVPVTSTSRRTRMAALRAMPDLWATLLTQETAT